MESPHRPVVTVSREFGSGGSDLAAELGRLTGWRVVDRDVIAGVARELRLPEEVVEARDEAAPRLGERLGALLAGAFPELVPPPGAPTELDYDSVAAVSERIVREAGSDPPVIIVGHGGMCLFSDLRTALHVRVVAPESHRVQQVADRFGMSLETALEEVRARDESREQYVQQRFGLDWDDSCLYSLVLNSKDVPPAEGARAVAGLLQARGWMPERD